jgi:TonB family protein
MIPNYSQDRTTFGLLPESSRSPASFIASSVINGLILMALFIIGAMARQVVVEHKYENTLLIFPKTPPPRPVVKLPEPPHIKPPEVQPEVQPEPPKISLPEAKPDPKPVQMEARIKTPVVKAGSHSVVLARQPKSALKAAMPSQSASIKPVARPVHLGDTFGVTPNPNPNRPATVVAMGNPYGGLQGSAVAPQGVVHSMGIGDGLRSGSNAGTAGKVALAGVPGDSGAASSGSYPGAGKVAAAGIPTAVAAAPAPVQQAGVVPTSTSLEIVATPPAKYTSEARQLRIQGDVVLRVTFTASGEVLVQSVVRGLGHGLDEEACRAAEQIRFHPATRNGQPMDSMTTVIVKFQLT